jgi:AcrR family transcriptional regulator
MNEAADAPPASPLVAPRSSIGARRHPEAQRAILAAAHDLLREQGYAGFSIEAVARRSGAGKPTIYRWWASKAALLAEVIEAEKGAVVPTPDTGTFLGDLMTYTTGLFGFWRHNPVGMATRALIAEAQTSDQALEALRDTYLPRRLVEIRPMFERAARRGELAEGAADDVMEFWVGYAWLHLLTGRLSIDATLERTMRCLAGGAAPAGGS